MKRRGTAALPPPQVAKNSRRAWEGKHKKMKTQNLKFRNSERNWVDLPSDVMFLIFLKLSTVEILNAAQFVCRYWQQLSKNPRLFSSLTVAPKQYAAFTSVKGKAILKQAISRSYGTLTYISLEAVSCNDTGILHYIAHHANSLRSLRLSTCNLHQFKDRDALIEACSKLPLLENLQLNDTNCHVSASVIKRIGRCCSSLRYFKFNHGSWREYLDDPISYYDDIVSCIAENMPQLRGLDLQLAYLLNKSLETILDLCPYLECLNVSGCHFNDLEEDLRNICVERFRDDVSLPPRKVTPSVGDLTRLPAEVDYMVQGPRVWQASNLPVRLDRKVRKVKKPLMSWLHHMSCNSSKSLQVSTIVNLLILLFFMFESLSDIGAYLMVSSPTIYPHPKLTNSETIKRDRFKRKHHLKKRDGAITELALLTLY